MRVFVILGVIEFIDGDAYIRKTEHSGMYWDHQVEESARLLDMDYIVPHHFDGRIIFNKLQKESWSLGDNA